jgi:hypothetical protein
LIDGSAGRGAVQLSKIVLEAARQLADSREWPT